MTPANTYANKYWWHLHHSDCRNTLIYMHVTSHSVTIYDIGLDSLASLVPEAGDFVE